MIDYEAAYQECARQRPDEVISRSRIRKIVDAALGDRVLYEVGPRATWVFPDEQDVLDRLLVQFHPEVKS